MDAPALPPALRVRSSLGLTLPVFELLAGHGPSLLLAHATGLHGPAYGPLAEGLSPFRVLAPDLRGHGDAPSPPGYDYSWQGFAEDVLAVAGALSGSPLFGFGHSMGGAALLLAEQLRPGTFAGLYIFEPIVFPLHHRGKARGSEMVEAARRRRAIFPSRTAARENFARKPPLRTLDPRVLAAYVDHGFAERPDGSVALKLPGEEEGAIYAMSLEHTTFESLSEVGCPVVVARGALGGGPPAAVAEQVAAALPRGRLEAFDDLGHFGPLEAPERVARAIVAALTERDRT